MRNKVLSTVLLTCAAAAACAGDMGPVESYGFKPFVLGEAAYSWPQVTGFSVNSSLGYISSTEKVQGWGGRLATGISRQLSEKFALSFEGGLMYNDHIASIPRISMSGVTIELPKDVLGGSFDQYGFDLLGGINYVRPKYDLFFKAGALFENLRASIGVNANAMLQNNYRQDHFVRTQTQILNANIAQVMPEIKLGGAYHFNEDWSMTASWMHAFGGTLGFSANELDLQTGSFSIGGLDLDLNNPTINAVMFGLQYNFG